MAKVAVVGVGAIGGVLAGLLQVAGAHEITLCTRRVMDGLTVETPDGVVQVRRRMLRTHRLPSCGLGAGGYKDLRCGEFRKWLTGFALAARPVLCGRMRRTS